MSKQPLFRIAGKENEMKKNVGRITVLFTAAATALTALFSADTLLQTFKVLPVPWLFTSTLLVGIGVLAPALQPAPVHAQTAYSIANDSRTLIRFDVATPGDVTVIGNFSGATTALSGMDFRPANGLLYGYNNVTNQIVTVNPETAQTTLVSVPATAANTQVLGLDFNPVADRLCIVTALRQNLRVNVDTGETIVDGLLAYALGDPSAIFTPSIVDAAYTNNDNDPATGTQLYYIDYNRDTLVTTTNPNAGVLNTGGPLNAFPSSITGFDIYTAGPGQNTAYASFDNSWGWRCEGVAATKGRQQTGHKGTGGRGASSPP
jgi:hypothetical protein